MSEETAAAPVAVKPGWKTSEFWITMVGLIVSAVMASGVFEEGGRALQVAGMVMGGLQMLGYQGTRAFVKAKAAQSAPPA